MAMITCPSCNTPAPPGAVFCDHCGYDLRTVAPPTAPEPAIPAGMSMAQDIVCPTCQHVNIAGSAFCENCGAQLAQAARPATPPAWSPPAEAPRYPAPGTPAGLQSLMESISGRFVIQDTQVSLPIPPGKLEIILGREDPVSGIFPDIDLDPHGGHEAGVGRRHARLILRSGQVYLEDLDSVNGTIVNRQRIPAHQPVALKSGDEIRLGKLALVYFAG